MTFVALLAVGWIVECVCIMALLKYLERFEAIRRWLETDVDLTFFEPLRERIDRKWSQVASLLEECGRLHGFPGRAARLWKAVEPKGSSPEQSIDRCVYTDSLKELGSSLVRLAEKGRSLCHKYLKGRKPCEEVMTMGTLFSIVARVCRECSQGQNESCMLSKVLGNGDLLEAVQTEVTKQM